MRTLKETAAVFIEKQQQTEANLLAIIENADRLVYSIDREFRYITLNGPLKKCLKELFNLDAKPGDKVFDFLTEGEPEEALFWNDKYGRALNGEQLKFVKEFRYTGRPEFWSFSINPIRQNDEVTGLACFARNVTEIRNARVKTNSRVMALNASLERKVAERTAQLEKANRELETFSYTVAHDLKAPIRVIGGFISIVVKNEKEILSKESNLLLDMVQHNVRLMGNLVHDLLEFSRIQKVQLTPAEVNMEELVAEAIKTIEQYEHGFRCTIQVNDLLPCKGDPNFLKQVWINLISNAVKYSGKAAQPYVEIGCIQNENKTCYYIKDNGAGFEMSMADKLFEAFQRLHPRSEFEGSGVGLALVKRIITRHGGKIWAQAEVNKGATFYFTIPGKEVNRDTDK